MTDRALTFLPLAAGVLAGGLWSAVNLWCLSRALRTWLNPQATPRWRQIGWFLVKFPLLYAAVFGLVQLPGISLVGFGIGFFVVIMAAVFIALKSIKPVHSSVSSHGG
ncbi:MAG: hypothetical protein HY353_00145 [Candidatus Omnitrophica bacterium]|nr:hypothetical protein [Candidatus Omnitrophota bacterium]